MIHKNQFSSSHGTILYSDSQEGTEPLIFMHGLPTSKELWEPVRPYLNPAYRTITFDLNDYGQSEKIGRPISHQERADVLDELRTHLGLERFHLIAHDLGSSVAIDYMGKYAQHVKSLVIMSPPVYPDFKEPAIVKLVRIPVLGEGLVKMIRPLLFNIGIKRGLVHKNNFTPQLLEAFAGPFSSKAGQAALLRILRWGRPHIVFKNYPEIIQSITVPTLIIQGRQDPYIPATQVTRMHTAVANATLHFIEHGSHFLPIDTPEIVAQQINKFIPPDGKIQLATS
jgi:pimeloyl-ACP methyl ester carboxylesterase